MYVNLVLWTIDVSVFIWFKLVLFLCGIVDLVFFEGFARSICGKVGNLDTFAYATSKCFILIAKM